MKINHMVKYSIGILATSLLVSGHTFGQANLSYAIGSTGGSNYPIGVAITQVLNTNDVEGLESLSTQPGGGAANMVGVHNGQMDMGMVFSSVVYDGNAGNPPFNQPMTKAAPLFSLHPYNLAILVPEDSDIEEFADLEGKRVNVGPNGFSTAVIFGLLQDLHGFGDGDVNTLNLGIADSVEQLKDGHVDALFYAPTDWYGAYIELAHSTDIRSVEIDPELRDALNDENPGYLESTWPRNEDIYTGLVPKDTLAHNNVTVGNVDAIDNDLAYNIVKTIAENFGTIQNVEQSLDLLEPSDMAKYPGGEFHPGAARYYREMGWIE